MSAQQVGAYLREHEPATPGPAPLLAIARHFGVPIEWLIDDSTNNKIPITAAAHLDDRTLLDEVARRKEIETITLETALRRLEEIDWSGFAAQLSQFDSGQSLTDELHSAIMIAGELENIHNRLPFLFGSAGDLRQYVLRCRAIIEAIVTSPNTMHLFANALNSDDVSSTEDSSLRGLSNFIDLIESARL